MKLYPEEWLCAQRYQQCQDPPRFSPRQLQRIRAFGKLYAKWYRAHPLLHNALNISVLLFLFTTDILFLLVVPHRLLDGGSSVLFYCLVLAMTAAVHGFLSYSVIVFSMHEGAAHDRIIQRTGRISHWLRVCANNACRVFLADPIYYRNRHYRHHADFGTTEDGAFTNFVHPRRFWISLLPLAGLLDFNDYRIHTDNKPSRSRLVSFLLSVGYCLAVGVPMALQLGILFPLLVLFFFAPWIAFVLDRLRETTEHNLMALETENGARNLGCGLWGLLIGGGPWGQPCHLSHHLVPALPWYQQWLLHRNLLKLMTPAQRDYFTVMPLVGFPNLLWHVLRENHRGIKGLRTGKTTMSDSTRQS